MESKSKELKKKSYEANMSLEERSKSDKASVKRGIKKGKSNGDMKGKISRSLNDKAKTVIYAKSPEILDTMETDINNRNPY